MDGLDALLTPSPWAGKLCTVAQAIEKIPNDEDRAKVAAACDNPQVAAANLERAFVALIEITPTSSALRRHQGRRGDRSDRCKCP